MNQEPKIQEVDLIKVKVIKKKHIAGLRTNYQVHWPHYTFLGYITEWDAILLQHNETKHLALGQVVKYTEWLWEATKLEDSEKEEVLPMSEYCKSPMSEYYKRAYECAHSLPQLFLD